jgi:hypothetical protein
MEPHDDPEARIRELERPLKDVARASELGAGQYGGDYAGTPPTTPTTPLPPPAYGAPNYGAPDYGAPSYGAPPYGTSSFPGTSPRSSSRGWWVLISIFAVFAMAIAGGVAVYLLSSAGPLISAPSSRSSTSGGGGDFGGTIADPSGAVPVPETPTAPAPAPTPAPGESISVSGISETKTVACDNNSVDVSGISNTVTITGHCANLTVSGVQNIVTVDSADEINASGFDNRITFHDGTPQVDNSGGSNVVEQG